MKNKRDKERFRRGKETQCEGLYEGEKKGDRKKKRNKCEVRKERKRGRKEGRVRVNGHWRNMPPAVR